LAVFKPVTFAGQVYDFASVQEVVQQGSSDHFVRHQKIRQSGCRLFINDKGFFRDVTDEAGLFHSPISYSLGVAVGDIDNLPIKGIPVLATLHGFLWVMTWLI